LFEFEGRGRLIKKKVERTSGNVGGVGEGRTLKDIFLHYIILFYYSGT
jgi:hypothetical protein